MGSCRLSALDFTTHAVSLPVNRVCSFVVEALRKAQPQMLHPDDPLNPPNSQAEDLNFSDIPNGLAALKVVPFAGRLVKPALMMTMMTNIMKIRKMMVWG